MILSHMQIEEIAAAVTKDYNGHCNSCHYLEKMLNAYRPEWLYGSIRLDISYQRELMPEETYALRYHVEENTVQYQLQNAAALSSCIASQYSSPMSYIFSCVETSKTQWDACAPRNSMQY